MIKDWIRKALIFLFRLPIFWPVRRWLSNDRITILVYHRVSPECFENHLSVLRRRYNVVSLEDVRDVLVSDENHELPKQPLVITFDDGWKQNRSLIPVMKKYNIPMTIFLCAGLVGTHRRMWNYVIDRSRATYVEQLKYLPSDKRRKHLRSEYDYTPRKEFTVRTMLTWDEVRSFPEEVSFQSHGMLHPNFTTCTREELSFEFNRSREVIAEKLDSEPFAIAYTYGRYNNEVTRQVSEAGYDVGRSANIPGLNDTDENPFELKGITIPTNASVQDLKRRIAWGQFKTLTEEILRFFNITPIFRERSFFDKYS